MNRAPAGYLLAGWLAGWLAGCPIVLAVHAQASPIAIIPNLLPVAALLEGDLELPVEIAQLLIDAATQRTTVAALRLARRLAPDLPPPAGFVRGATPAGDSAGGERRAQLLRRGANLRGYGRFHREALQPLHRGDR